AAPKSGWQSSSGSCIATADASGPRAVPAPARSSNSHCLRGTPMNELEVVEILLVEDSTTDAEMTIRALKRNNLANSLVWVKDGAEALEFMYCTGAHAGRKNGLPHLILLDLKMPRVD